MVTYSANISPTGNVFTPLSKVCGVLTLIARGDPGKAGTRILIVVLL